MEQIIVNLEKDFKIRKKVFINTYLDNVSLHDIIKILYKNQATTYGLFLPFKFQFKSLEDAEFAMSILINGLLDDLIIEVHNVTLKNAITNKVYKKLVFTYENTFIDNDYIHKTLGLPGFVLNSKKIYNSLDLDTFKIILKDLNLM